MLICTYKKKKITYNFQHKINIKIEKHNKSVKLSNIKKCKLANMKSATHNQNIVK